MTAVRPVLATLLLLFATPGRAATETTFQLPLVASVVTAALAFIAPRALEQVPVPQLALWGLAAPAALDPTLAVELRDGSVMLTQNGRVFFNQPAPQEDVLWGALVAEALQGAWNASAAVRDAGTQTVLSTFFNELFGHLDPYSRYVPPEAADKDRARRSGEAGVGITLRRIRGGYVVAALNAGGPAAQAGVQAGDRLLAVDDQPTEREDQDTVEGWIAGPEGTDITLTVRGRRGVRTFEMERAVIPPETVFARRDGPLLVIRISGFAADTDGRLRTELTRGVAGAAGRTLRGVVLDLRGNRGGLLRQAVSAADLLMTRGVIATTAGRSPAAAHSWSAEGDDITDGLPLIVLVDGRSASAAEIVAAALSDDGRAVVVGSSTLGKGLVQTITTMPDGGELFVSWSRVLAPGGWPIQGLGVLPQVCTNGGQAAVSEQMAALEKGNLPLADALSKHRSARPPVPASEVIALRTPCPAAEPGTADMAAARYLLAHPSAYGAALLTPP